MKLPGKGQFRLNVQSGINVRKLVNSVRSGMVLQTILSFENITRRVYCNRIESELGQANITINHV